MHQQPKSLMANVLHSRDVQVRSWKACETSATLAATLRTSKKDSTCSHVCVERGTAQLSIPEPEEDTNNREVGSRKKRMSYYNIIRISVHVLFTNRIEICFFEYY